VVRGAHLLVIARKQFSDRRVGMAHHHVVRGAHLLVIARKLR
jgi:hypothetical protein